MRRLVVMTLMSAVVISVPVVSSQAAAPWAPRIDTKAFCYPALGQYEIKWKVVNTHPQRSMKVMSSTRPLKETVAGSVSGTLEQRVKVRWRWRAHGDTITKKGSASATLQLDGDCKMPVIEVSVTTASIHSLVSVYWGPIGADNSATDTLSPFSAVVTGVDPEYDIVSMTAFEEEGLNTTLTCKITADGETIEQGTGSGPYSSCSVGHLFELSAPIPVGP